MPKGNFFRRRQPFQTVICALLTKTRACLRCAILQAIGIASGLRRRAGGDSYWPLKITPGWNLSPAVCDT
jgi:hypothetical protein